MTWQSKMNETERPAYRLVRSNRKTIALIVHPDQSLEVRCPLHTPRSTIDCFVVEKASWIKQKQFESRQLIPIGPLFGKEAHRANQILLNRVRFLARQHHLSCPENIAVKDMVSQWGSCSSRGSISLNRRCACLPSDLLDYVILHEFCHLVQPNHSKAFWDLLLHYLPDAFSRKERLRQYRLISDSDREVFL